MTPERHMQITVTVNTPDPALCREVAREDRDYWNDLYDHEPDDE
ncbi:hypothetical protein [Streptomyces gossypii]|nr:hypothetical protein [Streptomyces gossypii]